MKCSIQLYSMTDNLGIILWNNLNELKSELKPECMWYIKILSKYATDKFDHRKAGVTASSSVRAPAQSQLDDICTDLSN